MRNLRRLLTPGWILGVLAVALFAWACFAVLAPWQLGKSDDLDARNSRLAESIEAPPAPLVEVVDGPGAYSEREWRRVTLTGRWSPDEEALLRLRSVDGEPVYQVLTVFSSRDGEQYLVNRGYIPVGENNTVPEYAAAPVGDVEITARLRTVESGEAEPVPLDGLPAVRVVDPLVLGNTLGVELVTDGYLQLAGDQPGSLSPAPIPGIENGPYLSYGLQWLAFGILAPAGLAYFAWAEVRARRRDTDLRAVEAADTGDVDGAPTGGGASGSVDPAGPDETPPGAGRHADGPAGPELPSRGSGQGSTAAPVHSHGSDQRSPAGAVSSPGSGGAAGTSAGTSDEDTVAARERAMRARYGSRDDAERRRALRRADRLRH